MSVPHFLEHDRSGTAPFFSVCIPQYNRTAFLIEALRSFAEQAFRNMEICISDGCSTDRRESDLIAALYSTGLPFVYRRHDTNQRYDANLRAAIDMSRGRYCLLFGNDDRPSSKDELQLLHDDLEAHEQVGVAITNFQEIVTGRIVRRMPTTGNLGGGPIVAARNFRNFSFVSGIVLHGDMARELTTDRWDGSEMYQMYIGSRIIASGLPLLSISRVAVEKDIQVDGERVDAYAAKPRLDPCPIIERKHTFHLLAPLVMNAIEPYVEPSARADLLEKIVSQILLFTYPFWIFEHRRVQSWNYAAGICLGMRPNNLTDGETLTALQKARLASLYAASTVAGLTVPVEMFDGLRPFLYRIAKSGRKVFATREARA
jgi:glycosyltransferase involved in cell wall biosynthesis